MVAGGPSEASDHRIDGEEASRPRQGSRTRFAAASATPSGVGERTPRFPVVARFARTTGYPPSHLRWLHAVRKIGAIAFFDSRLKRMSRRIATAVNPEQRPHHRPTIPMLRWKPR